MTVDLTEQGQQVPAFYKALFDEEIGNVYFERGREKVGRGNMAEA